MTYITNKKLYISIFALLFLLISFIAVHSVNAQNTVTADIKINGSDGTVSVPYGDSITVSWTSTNAQICKVIQFQNAKKSGTKIVKIIKPATYEFKCTGPNGVSAEDSVSVNVSGGVSASISANGSHSSITVPRGDTVTISWTSTNAQWCMISQFVNAQKSGTKLVTVNKPATYTIKCAGPNGAVVEDSITINNDSYSSGPTNNNYPNPNPLPPQYSSGIVLKASPPNIKRGESAVLSWNAYTGHSCVASGGWSGSKVRYGSESVFPTESTRFNISCNDDNRVIQETITVFVGDTPLQTETQSINLEISTKTRNVTIEETLFQESTTAQSLDNIEFELLVKNTGNTASGANIKVNLPADLFFTPASTIINDKAVADGIVSESGIDLGTIAPNDEKTIRFAAVVYYGISEKTVSIEAIASSNSNDYTSSASINIEDRGRVLGAAVVSTGPKNMMLWTTVIAFVLALITYIAIYRFELQKNKKLHHAYVSSQLQIKKTQLRIKERNQ